MDTTFDPPAFRFTVRTPESRHAAIKKAATRMGMTPGQLVQALFDRLDLSKIDGGIAAAADDFQRLYPRPDKVTKELTDRANSVGLTVNELKVFRALVSVGGAVRIARPNAMDMEAISGVTEGRLDDIYDALMTKGFIALAPGGGRTRRAFQIARMPEL